MNKQEAERNEWLEIRKKLSNQLASLTPEQINKIKQDMDKQYDRYSDDVSNFVDYDSFLVKSDIVETRLVKELVLYAMQLRDKRIKEILAKDMKLVDGWFTDVELNRQISEIAVLKLEGK